MRQARRRSLRTLLGLLVVGAAVPACGGGGGGGGGGGSVIPIVLASASALGVPGNGASSNPVMSSNGQFIAFQSVADNLVASDTAQSDIFRKDMTTGAVLRVSRTPAGAEPDAACFSPSMSADGRYIAYVSMATDIIAGGTFNGARSNVFLFDAQTLSTTLVSHSTADLTTEATGNSSNPCVVATGGGPTVYVTYESDAQDIINALTYGGTYNNIYRKTAGGAQELVSRDVTTPTTTGGAASNTPSMSADGNLIAFQSAATNLITAATDTNGVVDVFVRDMTSGVTTRVSLTDADAEITGQSVVPQISADGAHVVFMSQGTNLGDPLNPNDIYVRGNWATGAAATTQMSLHPTDPTRSGENCNTPAISSDGNLVVWPSASPNFVNGDTNLMRDLFRRNRTSGALDRVSLTNLGIEATGGSGATAILSRPAISTGGTFIAFDYDATNMLSTVTTVRHIFRRG